MYIKGALKCGNFYHVFNQDTEKDLLFFNEENYLYFLKGFSEIILPIADLYGYCLIPNHFHLLIKIKSEKEVFDYLKMNGKFPEETITLESIKKIATVEGMMDIDILGTHLSKLFSNFFNSYSKAINEQEKRRGSLFEKGFSVKLLETLVDIKSCLVSIHNIPIQHNLVMKIEDWKFSSFEALVSDKPTRLKRDETINWFENKENFLYNHNQKFEYSQI